ncbi:hypothetical protein [Phreatobacter sp.]|uniref:hypothetical protein n=1 Tax=Phreatobacter sp. TaxID=1966341 RepID=UPI003F72FE16
MSERRNLLPIVSLFVAGLSLMAAAYQSYSHGKNVEVIQRNVVRAEYLRTCREIIEGYFQIRLRAEALNEAARTGPIEATGRREAEALVFRFGAMGTFLANFRDEAVRQRYTDLSWRLLAIVREAVDKPKAEFDTAYAGADRLFTDMNEDCAKTARLAIL